MKLMNKEHLSLSVTLRRIFAHRPYITINFCIILSVFSLRAFSLPYELNEAIAKAQIEDPWISGSNYRQKSLEALSVEAGSLPDPTISMGIANLPTDTFNFSQEAMTQLKIGISQKFPRGKTLSLERKRLKQLSEIQLTARKERRAKVALIVSQLWLDAYRNELIIHLIEKDRGLFEYLVDVSQSNYTSASGTALQQDVVRAQLELTRLDDRLAHLRLQLNSSTAKLSEWLNDSSVSIPKPLIKEANIEFFKDQFIDTSLINHSNKSINNILSQHPFIESFNTKIRAYESSVDISMQGYKPEWGVNASYGYRDHSSTRSDRSDFISAGITVDLPFFSKNRQDQAVRSAKAELAAVKTERILALRKLKSGYESSKAIHYRLNERRSLFNSRLLDEMAQQAESALSAYTNDTGDFSEVIRARIAELNARIEAINIEIDIQKNIAQLNYYKTGVQSNNASINSL